MASVSGQGIFENSESVIDRAIEQANPNVLRMALYQAVRDPELARMRVDKAPYWGGAFQVATLAEEAVPIVREKARRFLQGGGQVVTDAPSQTELREMMDMLYGEPVSNFVYEVGRGDLGWDEFPLGVSWDREPSADVKADFPVVIVGAGLGGLAAAIQLQRLGIPFTVIERNAGVGGTWWVNNYPEARVDVPSHEYQYSFMRHYRWQHWFATRDELVQYCQLVAEKYGLTQNIRFRSLVSSARWDEAAGVWHLAIKDDDGVETTMMARILISAAGLFNAPNLPDIPGIESFAGKMFHTTEWDHGYDYTGKRVGQIGVGSTGAQLMPAVADKAAHLTVYQRSPQWITGIDGYRDAVPEAGQWLFDHFPYYWNWFSFFTFTINMGSNPEGLQNVDPAWQGQGGAISQRNDALRAHNEGYIRAKTGGDVELQQKLTPILPPFVKRPVVDNGWYEALARDNVELLTEPISRITPAGIVTADGKERSFDLLLLCAGFKVDRYLWPVRYEGRGGVTLEQTWAKDGPRAFLGLAVPRFPNLFILYGPNAQARAGGLIKWLELWARYAVKAVVKMIEAGGRSLEVKQSAFELYNQRLDTRMESCIWGMFGKTTYYVNEWGRSGVNMPWLPSEYYEWVREPDMDDYIMQPR